MMTDRQEHEDTIQQLKQRIKDTQAEIDRGNRVIRFTFIVLIVFNVLRLLMEVLA